MAKPALGRGLSALLGGKPAAGAGAPVPASTAPGQPHVPPAPQPAEPPALPGLASGVERVPVTHIRPSHLQPRRDFPEESLRELCDSIRAQGILQPLVVRRQKDHLELIAGERRWRAAQLAGLTEVPVIVRDADDATALELMLVENLQREGLNPIDEAQGYSELIERFHLTQDAVATKVGRSRAAVANALRLLKLPADVQLLLRNGHLSTGHAKVIVGLPSADVQSSTAARAVSERLSVRQVEELAARLDQAAHAPAAPKPSTPVTVRDPHVAAVEDRLRQRLGTKVTLRYRQGRGQIDIRFYSDDELERVLEMVGVRMDD